MKIRTLTALLMVAALAAPQAIAQEAAPDDILSKIISVPNPQGFSVNGVRTGARVRSDSAVQGGKAYRIPVPGRSEQPWAVSASVPINKPVRAGDSLVLAFWARLEEGEGGATTAILPANSVQLSHDPYTAVFGGSVTIGPEWKLHEIRGRADKDYAAGQLNVSFHLATGKQTVDLGPVFVLDMGQPTG